MSWPTFRTLMPMKSNVRATAGASYPQHPTKIGRFLEATPQRLRAAFQTARRLLWANAGPVGISAGEMIDVDSDIDSVLNVLHQAGRPAATA